MAETSATLLERLNDRSDSVAWRRLVDLYSPLINAWLRRHGVSAEDAEDLTQEVLGGRRPRGLSVPAQRASRGVSHLAADDHHQLPPPVVAVATPSRFEAAGSPDITAMLDQLEDPASDLSRRWDREHDQHVLERLLELIEPEFEAGHLAGLPEAGHRRGMPAKAVAAELGMTVNAVLIAKSRVLSHLRRDADGLVD